MKKIVMRKAVILLSTVSFLLIVVNAFAATSYGVQNNQNQNNESATIQTLLAQARAQTGSSAPSDSNANNGNNEQQNAGTTTSQSGATSTPTVGAGLNEQAFANTVSNMMPLSPDQIKTLRRLFDQSQRAVATYPGVPPKPTSTSVIVNLSPGATPPVVRLSAGFITSLVFIDSTGAPWPIQAIDVGDPNSFNVQWNKTSNTLLVQALTQYKPGNLAVILQGLDTPVMLTLLPGQDAVDYRVDLRVPGIGPNANPVLNGLPSSTSPQLLQVLNGIPPENSKPVTIQGGECQGWVLGGHLYLRTRLTVLSPAWISTMSSADGTHAYELQTTPVVLASQQGKLVTLTIEGL